jgi:hypothetical protein
MRIALAFLAIALAGCGGGNSATATTTAQPPAQPPAVEPDTRPDFVRMGWAGDYDATPIAGTASGMLAASAATSATVGDDAANTLTIALAITDGAGATAAHVATVALVKQPTHAFSSVSYRGTFSHGGTDYTATLRKASGALRVVIASASGGVSFSLAVPAAAG